MTAVIVFLFLVTAFCLWLLRLASLLVCLVGLLSKGVLVVAAIPVLQILDHPLKIPNLGSQPLDKLLIAPVAGTHAVERQLQGLYEIKQAPVVRLEDFNLVDVFLALHI